MMTVAFVEPPKTIEDAMNEFTPYLQNKSADLPVSHARLLRVRWCFSAATLEANAA